MDLYESEHWGRKRFLVVRQMSDATIEHVEKWTGVD
jgi:hypothetical protein